MRKFTEHMQIRMGHKGKPPTRALLVRKEFITIMITFLRQYSMSRYNMSLETIKRLLANDSLFGCAFYVVRPFAYGLGTKLLLWGQRPRILFFQRFCPFLYLK